MGPYGGLHETYGPAGVEPSAVLLPNRLFALS